MVGSCLGSNKCAVAGHSNGMTESTYVVSLPEILLHV